MTTETQTTDAESLINDDVTYVSDLPARTPRNATEMRIIIGAAADYNAVIRGFDADTTNVVEAEDGDYVRGKIGITKTTGRAFSTAKQLINAISGGEVTSDTTATKRAGNAGVYFRVELADGPAVETDGGEDDATPHADPLVKEWVAHLNSHGLSSDHVDVHNDVCITVDVTGKTHRGKVKECTPGLLRRARSHGWYAQSIGFDADTVTFRRDPDDE